MESFVANSVADLRRYASPARMSRCAPLFALVLGPSSGDLWVMFCGHTQCATWNIPFRYRPVPGRPRFEGLHARYSRCIEADVEKQPRHARAAGVDISKAGSCGRKTTAEPCFKTASTVHATPAPGTDAPAGVIEAGVIDVPL